VVVLPTPRPESVRGVENPRHDPVVLEGDTGVIDPQEAVAETVFESARDAVVPRAPVILDPAEDWPYGSIPPVEETPMAVDWGSILGNVAASYVGARYAPTSSPVMGLMAPGASIGSTVMTPSPQSIAGPVMAQGNGCATCPTGSPRYSKICNATGDITPLRRRRRRRLLTAGDLADIASLKAVVGGGAALNAAVVKAMR